MYPSRWKKHECDTVHTVSNVADNRREQRNSHRSPARLPCVSPRRVSAELSQLVNDNTANIAGASKRQHSEELLVRYFTRKNSTRQTTKRMIKSLWRDAVITFEARGAMRKEARGVERAYRTQRKYSTCRSCVGFLAKMYVLFRLKEE